MDKELRENIVNRRVQKAKETIDEAKLALEHNQFRSALNRIYYAVFYMASALAARHDFATSKHKQLMGWFNKEFINTNKLKKELWDTYKNSYENRQESDYLDFVEYSKEEVENSLKNMLIFVSEIENLIKQV